MQNIFPVNQSPGFGGWRTNKNEEEQCQRSTNDQNQKVRIHFKKG